MASAVAMALRGGRRRAGGLQALTERPTRETRGRGARSQRAGRRRPRARHGRSARWRPAGPSGRFSPPRWHRACEGDDEKLPSRGRRAKGPALPDRPSPLTASARGAYDADWPEDAASSSTAQPGLPRPPRALPPRRQRRPICSWSRRSAMQRRATAMLHGAVARFAPGEGRCPWWCSARWPSCAFALLPRSRQYEPDHGQACRGTGLSRNRARCASITPWHAQVLATGGGRRCGGRRRGRAADAVP